MTETRVFKPQVHFPCVCGKPCTAGKVALEDGTEDLGVTHPDPPCEVYVKLEPDDFLEVCRKKLEGDLAANPELKPS
jgi:hypothetical protein